MTLSDYEHVLVVVTVSQVNTNPRYKPTLFLAVIMMLFVCFQVDYNRAKKRCLSGQGGTLQPGHYFFTQRGKPSLPNRTVRWSGDGRPLGGGDLHPSAEEKKNKKNKKTERERERETEIEQASGIFRDEVRR